MILLNQKVYFELKKQDEQKDKEYHMLKDQITPESDMQATCNQVKLMLRYILVKLKAQKSSLWPYAITIIILMG